MSREAMKLALEALENAEYGDHDKKELNKAIIALREELARQESTAWVTAGPHTVPLVTQPAKPDFWEGYVPEPVKPATEESSATQAQQALDKKAENARELGLDYEPAQQEPVLQDIEQYRLQMAGISTAAIGYWKESDGIHPDYDTIALRDVAKLYAKYDELYRAQRKPLTDAQLEKGRDQTFSINNPFCPCDSKTFRKVARWVEAAHGIKENT